MEPDAISPLDGRYGDTCRIFSEDLSETALIKHRFLIEGQYLIKFLLRTKGRLPQKHVKIINAVSKADTADIQKVKQIETKGTKKFPATRHDVKAVEYRFGEKLASRGLSCYIPYIHFALTSEDINNLAYAVMLSSALNKRLLPKIAEIRECLNHSAKKYKNEILLARTHGQAAVPTTFGKEFRVFSARIQEELNYLSRLRLNAKLNGAAGNYNALCASFPRVNWLIFTKDFIVHISKMFKVRLRANLFTTQIEPHDSCARLFDSLRRLNTILIDLCQDMWRYISDGLILLEVKQTEVGSSTMPQKINPINFENAEGNLGLANALFSHFSAKLPISRLQRDLSDSTVERNFGVPFAHSYIAYLQILEGFSKIAVNSLEAKKMIDLSPEIYAEAIQIILRREGKKEGYEKVKKFCRGKKLTKADIWAFIDSLKLNPEINAEIKKIIECGYTGLASKIASMEDYAG